MSGGLKATELGKPFVKPTAELEGQLCGGGPAGNSLLQRTIALRPHRVGVNSMGERESKQSLGSGPRAQQRHREHIRVTKPRISEARERCEGKTIQCPFYCHH